jgi:uncharacterized protein YecE (DUF72 family)
MKDIKTGCSGFYYKPWVGTFYPEGLAQSKWFAFYCEHFATLELNVTFYRFPKVEGFKSWFDKSPSDFLFSVKAPRIITHYKKLKDCEELIENFYTTCERGLKNKLSCLLFQFPPNFHYKEETLGLILKNLRPGYNNIVEFRHGSWWNEEAYRVLKEKNIIFCSVDHPTLPGEVVMNNSVAYIRMHGKPKLFQSAYSSGELKTLHGMLCKSDIVTRAFVFFNNTDGTGGIKNAEEFKRLGNCD